MHGDSATAETWEAEEDNEGYNQEDERQRETKNSEITHGVMKVIHRNTVSVVRPGEVC